MIAARPDATRPNAYVVACFGDPGLDGMRNLIDVQATVPRGWELAESYTPGQLTTNSAARCPIMTMVACGRGW